MDHQKKIKKQKGVLSVEEIKKIVKKFNNEIEKKRMVERSTKKHADQK